MEDMGEAMDVDTSAEMGRPNGEQSQLSQAVSFVDFGNVMGDSGGVEKQQQQVPSDSYTYTNVDEASLPFAPHADSSDADADGDTDEEDAYERDAVLQDVLWNGVESDTSQQTIDVSFDASLTQDAEDDSELILPSIEQQQDIAAVEHFFAHSAAPSQPEPVTSFSSQVADPSSPPPLSSAPSPDCLYSWCWVEEVGKHSPEIASPLAACVYVLPSPSRGEGVSQPPRRRYRPQGPKHRNAGERGEALWKEACRSRVAAVMRAYKEPTIRALVEQQMFDFQSSRGARSAGSTWEMYDPDTFDDWMDGEDEGLSSESEDDEEDEEMADTKPQSVKPRRSSRTRISPPASFKHTFSLESSEETMESSEDAEPPMGRILPPPPPLSSISADLGHMNDESLLVFTEEAHTQALRKAAPAETLPDAMSIPSSPIEEMEETMNTQQVSTFSRSRMGSGTPPDPKRRHEWFLGIVPDLSSIPHVPQLVRERLALHPSPLFAPNPEQQIHDHSHHPHQFGGHGAAQYAWPMIPGPGSSGSPAAGSNGDVGLLIDWDRLLASVPADEGAGSSSSSSSSSSLGGAVAEEPQPVFEWPAHGMYQHHPHNGYYGMTPDHHQQGMGGGGGSYGQQSAGQTASTLSFALGPS